MAFRASRIMMIVTVVVIWILFVTVLPIYIPQVRQFGFFFPIFFFPFFGGRRRYRRPAPSQAPADDASTQKNDDYEYANILETGNAMRTYSSRNYIFYVIAAAIFAIGVAIALTQILNIHL